MSIGHGAFELCLPSLGFLFTKLVLRTQLLGQRCRMMCWGREGQIGHRVQRSQRHVALQHYALGSVLEVYAEQPIDCDAAGHRHYEIESYVVYGLHVSMYHARRW